MTYGTEVRSEPDRDYYTGITQLYIDDLYREFTEDEGLTPKGPESDFYRDVVLPMLQEHGMAASLAAITWQDVQVNISPDEGVVTIAISVPIEGKEPVALKKEFKVSAARLERYLTKIKPIQEAQAAQDAKFEVEKAAAIKALLEFSKDHMNQIQPPEKWKEIGAATGFWPTAHQWEIVQGRSPDELLVYFYKEEWPERKVADVLSIYVPEETSE